MKIRNTSASGRFFVNLLKKKVNNYVISLLFVQLLILQVFSQEESTEKTTNPGFRIMFYNVENYFDAEVDTSLSYNEFTPGGDLHWTSRKFEAKRNALYRVITDLGGWSSPTIIGMVEVENDAVLASLIKNTPLNKKGYQSIHFDSPDFRGIDAALLYRPPFTPLSSIPIRITDPKEPSFTTRDMLYVVGLLGDDTVHVVVNHWTSRYRGLLESEPKRMLQAYRLLQLTDSICGANPAANIIVMGDFNDGPENASMQELTKVGHVCPLINLPLQSQNKSVRGTHKFQGKWAIFDQFIVSKNMIDSSNNLQVVDGHGNIFTAPLVLETDEKFGGQRPNRTNIGFTYHGGYSDHLPVFLDIKPRKP